MSEACENRVFVALSLDFCFWVVSRCSRILSAEQSAYRCENFTRELNVFFHENVGGDAVRYNSVIEEKICNVRGRPLLCRYDARKLRIEVGDSENILLTLGCFGKITRMPMATKSWGSAARMSCRLRFWRHLGF